MVISSIFLKKYQMKLPFEVINEEAEFYLIEEGKEGHEECKYYECDLIKKQAHLYNRQSPPHAD